jgi:hypothetical protein
MSLLNPIKVVAILLMSILVSCSADRDGDDSGSDDGGNTPLDLEISSTTDSRGIAKVTFQNPSSASKFMVSAQSKGGNDLTFTKVSGGGQNYLTPGGEEVSLANSATTLINSINVPSRAVDKPLTGAVSFDVEVRLDVPTDKADEVTFSITSREDSNLSAGNLNLNVFYVGDIGQENETKAAMTSALAEARNIMSNSASINLTVTEFNIAGPVSLPMPLNGSSLYESASNTAPSPSVNVFVGGDIAGTASIGEVLGISAGIPGPAIPSQKSAVAVSIFTSAGSDGVFNGEDIRVLGETIAHESGHFMGLFHPVDFSGSLVADTDPLADTESCSFLTDCVSRVDLIGNLMFPTPVADGDGSFVRQNKLSAEQKGVLNRYVAVR